MVKIIKIKSALPETEYAPAFDISLGLAEWDEYEKIDKIRDFLISKEDEIKQIDARHDGGTGLGDDAVTSRFGKYHLFDLANECPEINDMANFFRSSYLNFVTQEANRVRELDSVCWFNILRTGEKIDIHGHGCTPRGYLSGNMHLDDYPTTTFYQCPYDKNYNLGIENKKGRLLIFPSYVQHFSDVYNNTNERLSVAFDLYLSEHRDEWHHDYVERDFMSEAIFKELTS